MIKRNIFALCALLMMLVLLGLTRPAAAQENQAVMTIQQLRIQVMPEFDDPRVLVIVQGRMNAAAEEFPRPVTFRVPLGAQINQMATMNITDGSTTALAFDTAPDPADPRWTLVTYTLDGAHFFYEFYYDPLSAGRERDFTYVYSTLQPVNDLQIEIQEPLRSTGFATEPAATLSRTDAMLGFTYHQFTPGNLAAGESWSANVSYAKPDQDPSLSREAVQAMQAGGSGQNGEPASVTMTTNEAVAPAANGLSLPAGNSTWLFAGVIMGVLVGGAFVGYSRWIAPDRNDNWPIEDPGFTPGKYCTQCGSAVKATALYCHHCGNKLDE